MDPVRIRIASVVVIVVAAVWFGALRAPMLSVPLERDEGEYAYIAQRMGAGEVPYRDAFDQKPPGVFLAYRIAFAAFGESIEAIHGFAYAWTALTAWVLFAGVARLAGPLAAAFATLVLAIVSIDPRLTAQAANTELFMLLPLVGSLYCLIRALEDDRGIWWFGCGFLTLAAATFKQVAAVQVLLIAAAAAFSPAERPRIRRLFFAGLWTLLGAAAALAPVVAYFVSAGAWQPFLDAVLLHNLEYAQRTPIGAGLSQLGRQIARQWPSLAVFWVCAAGGLALRPRGGTTARWLLLGFLVTSALGTSIGLYFRPHYFVQLLPALAALCGVALAAVVTHGFGRSTTLGWVELTTMMLLVSGLPWLANRQLVGNASPGEISRRIYGVNPFPESADIAEYIRRTSGPHDRVFILGSEPQILFHAKRRSATRYIFLYPLTADFPDALDRQREVFAEVTAARPLYVVWVNVSTSLLIAEGSERFLFRETSRWLEDDYAFEFLVRPDPDAAPTQFAVGDRGSRLLDRLDENMSASAWIAVFRRVD